jgi:hypothetical protein
MAHKIKNKYKAPRRTEFTTKDLVIDVRAGRMYYKSNYGIYQVRAFLTTEIATGADTGSNIGEAEDGHILMNDNGTVSGSSFLTYDDSTGPGVTTIASLIATTADIDGGSIDGMQINGTPIGGTTPAAGSFSTLNTALDVIFNDAGIDVNFRVESNNDDNLFFVDGGTDRVGIGTGTPGAPLHIYQDSNTNNSLVELLRLQRHADDITNNANAEGGYIGLYVTDDNSGLGEGARITWRAENTPDTGEDDVKLSFSTLNDDTLAERMTINSVGNVGIGTTDPNELLEVRGNISGSGLALYGDQLASDTYVGLGAQDGLDGLQKVLKLDNLSIGTDNSITQVIGNGTNANGMVIGAGTINNGCGIKVRADAVNRYSVTSVLGQHLALTTEGENWGVDQPGAGGQIRLLENGDANIYKIQLRGNARCMSNGVQTGILSAANDVVAFASDGRLKENIVNISNPLEKLKQLRGVYFDWKEKTDEGELIKDLGFIPPIQKGEIGMIAQEVEKVIPQAITPAPFDDTETYKTIKYDRIIPLLVECINEQQKQIEEMKNKLNL